MTFLSNFPRTIGGKALPATLYLLVALLYFLCDTNQVNVTVLRMVYILYYAMSLYYIIKVLREGHLPRYLKALVVFVVVVFLYGIADIVAKGLQPMGSWGNMDFIWWHFNAVVPIFAFYYFGKRNIINGEWFQYVFAFCFIVVYISYLNNNQRVLEQEIWGRTEITNNAGYLMLSLLPMTAFFSKRKELQYLAIGIVAAFIILSFKRGAVLCFAVSLLFFIYKVVLSNRKMSAFRSFWSLALTIAGVALLYLFIMHLFETSDYFVERVDKTLSGNTSGRDDLYGYYLDVLLNSDVFQLFFGYGVLATIHELKYGIEAHNDWLEYVIDMGLVGISLYLIYWKNFVKEYFKSRRLLDDEVNLALGIIVIICFIRTFVSMSFYDMPFYSSIVLGYCIAKNNNRIII